MLNKYKKEIIPEEFTCGRLSDTRDNKTLIKGFTCNHNPSLATYLNQEAWREELSNYRAYYLVKEKNKIVCYFSLQCGLLVQCHKKELGGVTLKEIDGNVGFYIDQDKIHVTKALPAIELAHFCINDSFRKKKRDWNINNGIERCTVGKFIFYKFIAPRVISLSEAVGTQYIYLFCADDGSGRLKKYYENDLQFRLMDDMACIRPDYDDTLDCYTLKIEDLKKDLEYFEDCSRAQTLVEDLSVAKELSNFQAKKTYGIKDPSRLFETLVNIELAAVAAKNDKGAIVRIRAI